MGQSVSQQLGSGALGYGVDPDYLRSQILQQREKQLQSIQNPQQQLAARLGGLLGGGISNLTQDKGFFEVNDPLLTKVTQIQGIYNQVASQVDPAADPQKFFSELQKAYSDAGLGQQALMAAQEAQKAKVSGLDVQLKETQVLEKNPELISGRIEDALKSGNEQEAMRLANLQTRINQDRELAIESKQTAIAKDKAYIAYQNKLASDSKFEYKAVDPTNPLAGHWKFDKSGNAEPQYVPVPKSISEQLTPAPKADGKGKPEGKLDASKYMVGGTPASSPARETTWSGVSVQPKPVTPLSPIQERDFAIQRAYPTLVISTLPEEAKAQLAQQLGL
jgi:hypothetical protein